MDKKLTEKLTAKGTTLTASLVTFTATTNDEWPRVSLMTTSDQSSPKHVALQLCPPLQFGPLTYQPIECVVTSSNQSALWSCLHHLTCQLGEGCSVSFVRFVLLIRRKTYVWNSFGAFPRWVFGEFYDQRICSYVGELESVGQEWKHKPRVQIKSSKKDSDAMIFELLR